MLIARSSLGIRFKLQINTLGDAETQQRYHNALREYFEPHRESLSAASQERLRRDAILRILDSKDDRELIERAPRIESFLSSESAKHWNQVLELMRDLKVEFSVNPMLVRGLDYYTHTVFEFTVGDGRQDTVLAGGRYDGLSKALGGPQWPSVGWAAGVERLMLHCNTAPNDAKLRVAVVPLDSSSSHGALVLAEKLRSECPLLNVTLEKVSTVQRALKDVLQSGCAGAMFIGEREREERNVFVKDLRNRREQSISIDQAARFALDTFK